MSNARNLANLLGTGTQITTADIAGGAFQANKNLIINGAMQVAQRGTSFTADGYTVDRWQLSLSGGTATVTQEAFALGQTEVSGNPKNYLKVACSVGNNNCGINQPIENYAAGAGGKVTISFWAKGTNPAGGYFNLQLWQRMANGTGFHETALTLNSDWTYHTFIFELGSLSGFTANSSSHLDLIIRQPVGDSSTDAWELNITNVQLELGSVATPFEHRSYGEELALCQRYYQKDWYAGGACVTVGTVISSSSIIASINYSGGQMRTSPSITLPTAGQGANFLTFLDSTSNYPDTTGTFSSDKISNINFRLQGSGYVGNPAFVAGESSWLYAGSSAGNVYFEYDAEL